VTSCATSARALIGVGAFQVWNYYPAYQYGSTAAGQLARLLDPELDIRFQNIQLSLYGYGGAAILGVIISAYCLSQKDTTETVLPEAPIPKPLDDALEIARNRFARGEITAEEFEEMKRRLSG
jgi:hypothetical protein